MSDGLRLNLSSEEASSKARDYDVLPNGNYLCNIVEINEKEVQPGKKNSGKEYWNMRFVVDFGDYAGRSIYSNVMMFEGALYSAKQLVESVCPENIDGSSITIPPSDKLLGRQVVVTGTKYRAGSKRKDGTTRDQDQFEVKGFKAPGSLPKKLTKSELLPD